MARDLRTGLFGGIGDLADELSNVGVGLSTFLALVSSVNEVCVI